MKNLKFELIVDCSVGWNDEEGTATFEVGTLQQALDAVVTLERVEMSCGSEMSKELREEYEELKEMLESDSDEDIMFVYGVSGIQCVFEDDKGIKGRMVLSDVSGVDGRVHVNSSEYENEYERRLSQAKHLANEILEL